MRNDKTCYLAVENKKTWGISHLGAAQLVTAVNTLLRTIALVNNRNTLTWRALEGWWKIALDLRAILFVRPVQAVFPCIASLVLRNALAWPTAKFVLATHSCGKRISKSACVDLECACKVRCMHKGYRLFFFLHWMAVVITIWPIYLT